MKLKPSLAKLIERSVRRRGVISYFRRRLPEWWRVRKKKFVNEVRVSERERERVEEWKASSSLSVKFGFQSFLKFWNALCCLLISLISFSSSSVLFFLSSSFTLFVFIYILLHLPKEIITYFYPKKYITTSFYFIFY